MRKLLPALALLFLAVASIAQNNYNHAVTSGSYQDLSSPQMINGPDSIASAYYVNAAMLFPAFDAAADFEVRPSVPSLGAYVTRAGYVGVYESPGYQFTYVFHGYFMNSLRRVDGNSSIAVEITGTTGSKLLKFQWKSMGLESHHDSERVNFQIWFREDDKSISYHYGPSNVSANVNDVGVISLFRAPNSFANLTHATCLSGNATAPNSLVATNPTSFSALRGVTGFPPAGTVITFKKQTTGGKEILSNAVCDIFPNPFTNNLQLKYKGSFTWTLHDLSGKLLQQGTGEHIAEINTEHLTVGFYLVGLETGGKRTFRKLVKQ